MALVPTNFPPKFANLQPGSNRKASLVSWEVPLTILRPPLNAASMSMMRTLAMLAVGLAHLISAEFVVPTEVGSPVAYYALDEGTGFELRESISGAADGKVIYDPTPQTVAYDQPNWVNVRRPPATDVATGVASHGRSRPQTWPNLA